MFVAIVEHRESITSAIHYHILWSNSSLDWQPVLVQREMECGRSPLASIARASAGKRKQRTETATAGHRNRCASSRRWAGLDGRGPYSKRKANWLGKEASTERGVFNGMNAPGNGVVQMPSERVARGAGSVQTSGLGVIQEQSKTR